MNKTIFVVLQILLVFAVCHSLWAAVDIVTVPVGNPGNANDPNTGNLYGEVDYNYAIGKYDVTVGQYTAFLNAVAATDTYGLYNPNMATDLNIAGIAQNGTSGSYTYSVIGSPNKPITYVSWGDAARFANWLANGQPSGAEGPGTTETGSYMLNGATTDMALDAVKRSDHTTWVIPTENEWYKAAYYNPAADSYYKYATSSNILPTAAPPGNTPNTENYYGDTYAVTGDPNIDRNQNYLTDVGTYSSSGSPYGVFDMSGDVFQWTDTNVNSDQSRIMRGGSWDSGSMYLPSIYRGAEYPTYELYSVGFLVAYVPEPSTLALLALGSLGLLARRRFASSATRA